MPRGVHAMEEPAPESFAQPRYPSGRRKPVRWTKAVKEAFFAELSMSCDILKAARRIDVLASSCYDQRRRDAAFARDWDEALVLGYQALETRLLAMALNSTVEDPVGPLDQDLAKWLMNDFRRRAAGRPRGGHPPLKPATAEETDEVLLKKLVKVEARARAEATARDAA